MSNQKMIVPIKGMHCKSCELLIEENIGQIKGVDKAELDYHTGEAKIYYQGEEPSLERITEAVAQAGYSLGKDEDQHKFFSRDKNNYKDLGIAVIGLLGLYFLLKGLGLGSLSVGATTDNLTASVVLLVGLTAGFSTCMALVGGLILGVASGYAKKHPEATTSQKIRPQLFFNLGRILSYALLGGLLGLLGSVFKLSSFTLGSITIIVGMIMLAMGLQLIGIFPWADNFKLALPKKLSKLLGLNKHEEYSHTNSMVLGALTFFVPCGFTQAMQVYAVATGSFVGGALVMGLFAIGTLPGLLGVGGLTAVVKGVMARRFFKLAGLAVIVFAVFNINNGLNLVGWGHLVYGKTNKEAFTGTKAVNQDGVQVIEMKQTAKGYQPNSFTIKRGVPVKWVITSEAPYSCASSLILPKYNISKNLLAGENIIEFTPKEVGQINFSCSMGMYTGVFNVVDSDDQITETINNSAVEQSGDTCDIGGGAGGCGGSVGAPSAGSCGGGAGGGCGCSGGGEKFESNPGAVEPTTPATKKPEVAKVETQVKEQIIKSGFTAKKDIQPNSFTVKAGVPVKYIIDPTENGVGCMYAIMIPGLYNDAINIKAGQQIVMNFTPTKTGVYPITCSMGMQRGQIIVN